MEAEKKTIAYYKEISGTYPFREWRNGLTDLATKAAIDARIARFRSGNFGDHKSVGDGAQESRIFFGPGYRIYYGLDGTQVILLLGGDKSSQDADIQQAKLFWKDYKTRVTRSRETKK